MTLAFDREEEIRWEVQNYPNDYDELTYRLGGIMFHSVVTVKLIAIAKPKVRAQGDALVIGAVPM